MKNNDNVLIIYGDKIYSHEESEYIIKQVVDKNMKYKLIWKDENNKQIIENGGKILCQKKNN